MNHELADQILDLKQGDHLCLFYDKEPVEQMPALIPFVQDALTNDEQFIYIADDQTVEQVSSELQQSGINVARELNRGALKLWTRREWRQPGPLSSERKSEQVRQFIAASAAAGFKGIRFAAEMTWTLGPDITADQLEHWEATINQLFTPEGNARIICQYNRSRLRPEVLVAALHTHPLAILGEAVYPNPFYRAPLILGANGHHGQQNGQFSAPQNHRHADTAVLDWMVGQLRRAHTTELQRIELIRHETALKEAESAQRRIEASDERLRQFMALMPVGVYACDAQGRITFFNRRAVELWGGEPAPNENAEGFCTGYQTLPEGTFVPANQSPIQLALTQGRAFRDIEMFMQRRDGSQFIASVNIDPIRNSRGLICGTMTMFQDISGRKRAEEALAVTQRNLAEQVTGLSRLHLLSTRLSMSRETPEVMQLILENVTELHGTHLGLLSLYDAHYDRLQPAASVGFAASALEELAQPPAAAGADGQCLSERKRVIIEDIETDPRFEHYREAARRHGFRAVYSTPLLTRAGKTLGVLSVHFATPRRPTNQEMQWADMHARQAADFLERTKGQEAILRLAAIVESSDDAIVSKDLNGIITSWNQGAERIFGYRCDEVLGRPITILLPATRLNEEPKILERIRRGERLDHFETVRRRKDGTLIDISLTVSPIRDEEGRIIGASKIARDITEKKRAEQALHDTQKELARSHEDLEKQVQERTASLREAIAQMEEFSYSISHDLRAPVRAMHGYAKATIEDYGDKLDARGRDYLERIVRGGVRMDRLIQDILVYSKLARCHLSLQPVGLDRLVREIIQQYPEMQPPSAEVIVRDTLGVVTAHEPSLTQAISNLLNNAVKFVARGEAPKVQIWSERCEANVRLWVEDNGIGIKPEHQQRLFGMFERVHDGKKYEGTGIGLAIARKAIERMGGRIGVESDGMTGSRFWIELPVAQSSSSKQSTNDSPG